MSPLDFANSLYKRPDCRLKIIDFTRAYHKTLPDARSRSVWPRWRIMDELQKQFVIGRDADGVMAIAGLSMEPARQWVPDSAGRLVLINV